MHLGQVLAGGRPIVSNDTSDFAEMSGELMPLTTSITGIFFAASCLDRGC